jgi:hypothetical protein
MSKWLKLILNIMKNSSKTNTENFILKPNLPDELKNKLRTKYPQLTDNDLVSSKDNEIEMLRMIEYKLRKTKEEMQEIIAEL